VQQDKDKSGVKEKAEKQARGSRRGVEKIVLRGAKVNELTTGTTSEIPEKNRWQAEHQRAIKEQICKRGVDAEKRKAAIAARDGRTAEEEYLGRVLLLIRKFRQRRSLRLMRTNTQWKGRSCWR
jgi:hypothetical protein